VGACWWGVRSQQLLEARLKRAAKEGRASQHAAPMAARSADGSEAARRAALKSLLGEEQAGGSHSSGGGNDAGGGSAGGGGAVRDKEKGKEPKASRAGGVAGESGTATQDTMLSAAVRTGQLEEIVQALATHAHGASSRMLQEARTVRDRLRKTLKEAKRKEAKRAASSSAASNV
jgi:hypothetical protein